MSFVVRAGADKPPPMRLMPLLFDRTPPSTTRVTMREPAAEDVRLAASRTERCNDLRGAGHLESDQAGDVETFRNAPTERWYGNFMRVSEARLRAHARRALRRPEGSFPPEIRGTHHRP